MTPALRSPIFITCPLMASPVIHVEHLSKHDILSRITAPITGQVKIRGRVGSLLEVGTGFHPELTGRENLYLNGAILGVKKAEIDRKRDSFSRAAVKTVSQPRGQPRPLYAMSPEKGALSRNFSAPAICSSLSHSVIIPDPTCPTPARRSPAARDQTDACNDRAGR